MNKFSDEYHQRLIADGKRAPVQGWPGGIPWSLHLEAYAAYCKRWSPQEALIDLEGRHCRGGFGTGELDEFIPGWRERVSEIAALKAEVERLRDALAKAFPPSPKDAKHGPMTKAPEQAEVYWAVFEGFIDYFHWVGDTKDLRWFKERRCYARESDARAALAAMPLSQPASDAKGGA